MSAGLLSIPRPDVNHFYLLGFVSLTRACAPCHVISIKELKCALRYLCLALFRVLVLYILTAVSLVCMRRLFPRSLLFWYLNMPIWWFNAKRAECFGGVGEGRASPNTTAVVMAVSQLGNPR